MPNTSQPLPRDGGLDYNQGGGESTLSNLRMGSESMRCESCGAELPQGRETCEYCGSTWDQVVPGSPGHSASDNAVFDRIRRSPQWADRNSPTRQARLPQMPALATVAPIVFFVIFIAVSGFMAVMALGMAGIFGAVGFSHHGPFGGGIAMIPAFMAIVPIGFVVLGLFMIGKFRKRMTDFQAAPTLAHAAKIAGKRTQVTGGGDNSSASTGYYITAEFEDGRREEFAVMHPSLFGRVTEGDAGVLFVRHTLALDFDRVAG